MLDGSSPSSPTTGALPFPPSRIYGPTSGGNGTGVGRGRLFEEILIANKGYVLLVDGSTSPPPPSPALSPPIPSITVITGTIREHVLS